MGIYIFWIGKVGVFMVFLYYGIFFDFLNLCFVIGVSGGGREGGGVVF